MMRLGRVLWVAVLGGGMLGGLPAARAQPASDSTVVQVGEVTLFGRGITYGEILHEYRQLRPRPRPDSTVQSADPTLGIRGLVVDETATPAGRTFYEAFFLVWAPPPSAIRATVDISEQPLPGNSTAVLIRVDGELAFQARLPRRTDEIAELAIQAAQFIASRLGG